MHRLIILFTAAVFVSCQNTTSPTTQLQPEECVQVGTVTPHGVWNTKKQLARAGIPVFVDDTMYPLPYRILVPPEYRQRAVAFLRDIDQQPQSVGYGITHE